MSPWAKWAAAGFVVACAGTATAADRSSFSVAEAVGVALRNNPGLQMFDTRMESARRGVDVAGKYLFNPEVGFSYGNDYHVGIAQTVEWPGRRALRVAMARGDVDSAEQARLGFRLALATEVRSACRALLITEKVADVEQQRLESARLLRDATRRRVESGYAAAMEETRADVEVVLATRQMHAATRQVAAARVDLNLLLGRAADDSMEVADRLTEPDIPEPVDTLVARALNRHPDIVAQEIAARKRGLAIALAKKQARPDVTVEPFYEANRRVTEENTIGLALSVPLPLWNGGGSGVSLANAEYEESQADAREVRRGVEAEVRRAYAAMESARDDLALFPASLGEDLAAQMTGYQEKYADGQVSYLALIDSQRAYFDYQKSYYEAVAAAWSARARLDKAAAIGLEEFE